MFTAQALYIAYFLVQKTNDLYNNGKKWRFLNKSYEKSLVPTDFIKHAW